MANLPPEVIGYVIKTLDAFFGFCDDVEAALQRLRVNLATVEIEATGRNRLAPQGPNTDEEIHDRQLG